LSWSTKSGSHADKFPEYSTPFWGTTDIPGINIDTGKFKDQQRDVVIGFWARCILPI
jgi:hypothetical protein